MKRHAVQNEDNLYYIEDASQQRLYYRFTPAALISNFVPLIVILHDEQGRGALNFEYKMWNVLTPIDETRHIGGGPLWLHKDSDRGLLQELIKQVAEEYECEEHIYLYGKGAGGYGAIVHGILSGAHSVYAHSPSMTALHLKDLLDTKEAFPIFYLCADKNDDEKNKEVEMFMQTCEQFGLNVRTDLCDSKKEDEGQALKKILNMLEKMGT